MNVILCTMVKNEEKALPRLLRSCAKVVSGVLLTDTGSTDSTIATATKVCEELSLPLIVRNDKWLDFGTNRTNNLLHGREAAVTWGLKLDETFLLLLDADMELPQDAKLTQSDTWKPVNLIPQCDGRAEWSNVRLIRADVDAKYLRRTHEYISHSSDQQLIRPFVIGDHCDGGSRGDKFERDERLLRMDLADMPNNTRTLFYLGQTLHNLGRRHEAKQYYDMRAKTDDFPEEAWMARWEAAHCCDPGFEADARAFRAFLSRPQRVEPLAEMAKRACDEGRHVEAMALADMGKNIPIPKGEILWLSEGHYKWTFPYIEGISSYYVNPRQTERGFKACEYLVLEPGSPFRAMAANNEVFYATPIPGVRTPFPVEVEEGWTAASPCFFKTPTGYVAHIRLINYKIGVDGYFPVWKPEITGNKVRTRNVVFTLDKDRKVLAKVELKSPYPPPNPDAGILGFEDQRVVKIEGNVITTGGVRCDANSPEVLANRTYTEGIVPEMWESDWDLTTGEMLRDKCMSKGMGCQKNWLPYKGGYLYSHGIGEITFVDSDGEVTAIANPLPAYNMMEFRGSAAPIPYGKTGGTIHVVHFVLMQPQASGVYLRMYFHRFIYAEANWSSIKISKPFYLNAAGDHCIESCFGIVAEPGGILMGCAKMDREIYTIDVTHETVTSLFA